MKCPHCHNDEVPAEAAFCPFCGQKIEKPAKSQRPVQKLIVTTIGPASLKPNNWLFDKINLSVGENELDLVRYPALLKGFKARNPQNIVGVDMQYFEPRPFFWGKELFDGFSNLTSLNLEGLRGSRLKSVDRMFYGCHSLETVDLSPLDTSDITFDTLGSFNAMFAECHSLRRLDLSTFDTSRGSSFISMFNNCSSLEDIDLSSWNTERARSFLAMFANCSSLRSLDLSSFRTPKCREAKAMFANCTNLEHINMSGIDFSNCIYSNGLENMFKGCASLKSVCLLGCNERTINLVTLSLQFHCPSAQIIK